LRQSKQPDQECESALLEIEISALPPIESGGGCPMLSTATALKRGREFLARAPAKKTFRYSLSSKRSLRQVLPHEKATSRGQGHTADPLQAALKPSGT
jgi:hypothetical protein